MKAKRTNCRQERGAALPIALILLLPLTLLAVTIANRNILEELMSSSQRDGQQALMNAESGLALAQESLAQVAGETFGQTINEILAAGGDIGYNGYSLTEGSVTVVVVDNDDGDSDPLSDSDSRVVASSTGAYQGGERIVQAIFELIPAGTGSGGTPPLAIFAEDDLGISGNPFIWGPNANVHTNSDLEISGNPEIWGTISASGEVTISGDPVNEDGDPSEYEEGAALIETPYVFPPAYKPVATFYLTADCDVYSGWPLAEHTLLANDVKDNPDWMGSWNCDYNKHWILNGDTPPDGFYYVEGNVYLSSNPGEGTEAVRMSIVAEGFIEVSGNPNLEPYYNNDLDISDPEVQALIGSRQNVLFTNEVLFIAGNDLKINGNPEQHFTGIMAAHMEFDVSGAPWLEGALIAENGRAQEAQGFGWGQEITSGREVKNMVDKNWIGGNPTITDDDDGEDASDPEVSPALANMVAWREIVE